MRRESGSMEVQCDLLKIDQMLRRADEISMEPTIRTLKPAGCLRVRTFAEGRAIWDEMLTRCAITTLYHQNSWLQLLNRAYGFQLHLVTLEERDQVIAASVFACVGVPFAQPRFVSLPFSDYCPPLALNAEVELRLMQALKGRAFPGAPLEVRGVATTAEGWHRAERFVNWTLSFEPGLNTIERRLSTNFRRNLRRATRENIVVSRGAGQDYLSRFYRLHLLARRKFGLPAQPWRFFKLLHRLFAASDDVEVWIASRAGRDIAGAVILKTAQRIYYKWGARRPEDDSRANHLLLWNVFEKYCSNTESIDLGRTDVSNNGLMRFKKELGAHALSMPYSYYPQAPQLISAETLGGVSRTAANIWKNLPIPATRLLGRMLYKYLA